MDACKATPLITENTGVIKSATSVFKTKLKNELNTDMFLFQLALMKPSLILNCPLVVILFLAHAASTRGTNVPLKFNLLAPMCAHVPDQPTLSQLAPSSVQYSMNKSLFKKVLVNRLPIQTTIFVLVRAYKLSK